MSVEAPSGRPVFWRDLKIEDMTREEAIEALFDSVQRFHAAMTCEAVNARDRYRAPPAIPAIQAEPPGFLERLLTSTIGSAFGFTGAILLLRWFQ